MIVGYLIDADDNFHVIARHGKTRNLAIWSLQSLAESNSNLMENCEHREYPRKKFVVPEGGIAGERGLRNKALIVNSFKDMVRNVVV